jgi:7-cyano-7-deazaguanine synthase
MNLRRQFVLLSGGLDSSTVLYHALNCPPVDATSNDLRERAEAVSINYGQRHSKEMEYAARLCDDAEVNHVILEMPGLLAGSMLTDGRQDIPNVAYSDLPAGVSPTYVPFRNGLMISMLAAHAQKWVNLLSPIAHDGKLATIYIGAHAEDAERDAYPDCGVPFLRAMMDAVSIGTYGTVSLVAPLMGLKKSEVVEMGARLGLPFADTWSCYKGETLHCGICPTCRARKEAFVQAGVTDPTQYAA